MKLLECARRRVLFARALAHRLRHGRPARLSAITALAGFVFYRCSCGAVGKIDGTGVAVFSGPRCPMFEAAAIVFRESRRIPGARVVRWPI